MSTSKSKDSYHHGNLRAALLEAARDLLVEAGASKLSLRAVARQAGVSQTAPYRHFKDKAALLSALAAEGFRGLSQAMCSRGDGIADPKTRMAAYGQGYVAFATENPAVFQLMFGPEIPDKGSDEALCEAANAAFGVLAQETGGGGPVSGPADAALAAWSLVHGLATLINDGQIRAEMFGETDLDAAALSDRLGRFLDLSTD